MSIAHRVRVAILSDNKLDVAAAYPTNTEVTNESKGTTVKELVSIEGMGTEEFKYQSLNLSGGKTNAYEFCTQVYKMPTMARWLEAFEAEHPK